MAQGRGTNLRVFVQVFRDLEGSALTERLLDLVPADLGAALRNGTIEPHAWYPLAWNRALHTAAAQVTGEGLELARRIGRASVQTHFLGPIGAMLGQLSFDILRDHAARAFQQFYDTGRLEIVEVGAGACLLRWLGCVDFDALLWHDVLGGCEGALLAAGLRDPEGSFLEGGADGDRNALARLAWK